MSCPSRSVYVPFGSPGNARLRFLPSWGTTNGERWVNDSMLTTGTPVTVPAKLVPSSSRMTRVTAAIDEYSHPWMPPITDTRGPSLVPCRLKQGTSRPLRLSVVRTAPIEYVGAVSRLPLSEAELARLSDDALI